MTKAKFITFEGADGTGKSTQISLLGKHLESNGIEFIITREPGGTEIGEIIRNWVLHGEHEKLKPQTETLMMIAARAFHVENLIKPALNENIWVISDRYTDATTVYQGHAKGMSIDTINFLNNIATEGLQPDITFLLDASSRIGKGRIASRQLDYFEKESDVFIDQIRQGYIEVAKKNPDRVKIIQADQPIAAVFSDISNHLSIWV
jgi:dTMP kinase